jgi:hypothetical protein
MLFVPVHPFAANSAVLLQSGLAERVLGAFPLLCGLNHNPGYSPL